MRMLSASASFSLSALAALASFPVLAASDNGWYLGGNLGLSNASIDNERITDSMLNAGFSTTSFRDDERDLGFKLLAGYQFNRYLAIEGGYFDLGEFGFTATTAPPGRLNGDVTFRGVNLDLVALLPITERWSGFARVGANHAKAKSAFSGSGAVNVPPSRRENEERSMNAKFGLGMQYLISPAWAVRLEAERYRIDDSVANDGDIDLLSLGLVYRFFGGRTALAPAAVVAAATPKPRTAPAAATTEEYCSILDIQFEINADEIQREEQEKLAVLGTFLKKYPDTTAVIEGHTDNVGSPAQNRQLSQRRAESVVRYLVKTFGIAPSRLEAVGYGDTRPLASNTTQEGMRRNRRIGAVIACANDIEGLAVVPARLTMAMEIAFDRNATAVSPRYRDELARVARFLKANPAVTATVEGHAANLEGSKQEATDISLQRAQSVVNVLVNDFGVARSRLAAEGFAQTRRYAYNTSQQGQQDNRRVHVIFNYPE